MAHQNSLVEVGDMGEQNLVVKEGLMAIKKFQSYDTMSRVWNSESYLLS